jgi:hypothetical protein
MPSPIYHYMINLVMSLPIRRDPGVLIYPRNRTKGNFLVANEDMPGEKRTHGSPISEHPYLEVHQMTVPQVNHFPWWLHCQPHCRAGPYGDVPSRRRRISMPCGGWIHCTESR